MCLNLVNRPPPSFPQKKENKRKTIVYTMPNICINNMYFHPTLQGPRVNKALCLFIICYEDIGV